MSKVTLFVSWVDDFAEDIKKYNLKIVKESFEEPGFMITIEGDFADIVNFLETDYCMGMDDEDKEEILKEVK